MSGVATYRTKVLIGNWDEDARGRDFATRLTHPRAHWSTTTGEAFLDRGPAIPTVIPKAYGAIDGHLAIAHAPTTSELIARRPPTFVSEAGCTAAGLPTSQFLSSKSEAPLELNRTEKIRARQLLRAAGVDAWDPAIGSAAAQGGAYNVPTTFTPTPALTAALERAAPGSRTGDGGVGGGAGHVTLSTAALNAAAGQARIVGRDAVCDAPLSKFARTSDFSKEFARGTPNLRK